MTSKIRPVASFSHPESTSNEKNVQLRRPMIRVEGCPSDAGREGRWRSPTMSRSRYRLTICQDVEYRWRSLRLTSRKHHTLLVHAQRVDNRLMTGKVVDEDALGAFPLFDAVLSDQ